MKKFYLYPLIFILGLSLGWVFSEYRFESERKVESMVLLDQANSFVNSCDYTKAVIYAAQSFVLYKESPLSGLMLYELVNKKDIFEKRCNSNIVAEHNSVPK